MASTEDNAEPAEASASKALVPLSAPARTYRLARVDLPSVCENAALSRVLAVDTAELKKKLGRTLRPSVPPMPALDAFTADTSALLEQATRQLTGASLITSRLADLARPSVATRLSTQLAGATAITRIASDHVINPAIQTALADIGGISRISQYMQQVTALSTPVNTLFPTTNWLSRSLPLIELGESVRRLIQEALAPSWLKLTSFEQLERRWLLWDAARTRETLLTEPSEAKRNSAVDNFVYRRVGLSRPARREEREAIRDAAIEVLLSSDWLMDEAVALEAGEDGRLRKQLGNLISRTSAGYKPVWRHQVRGRWIGSLDQLVVTEVGETSMAAIVRDPQDSLAAVRDGGVTDPRLISLLDKLTPPQQAVLVARAHHGDVTWTEAAELAGVARQHAEGTRRKLRRLLLEQEQRAALRGSAG